jgi:hypothetical protein
MMDPMMDPRMDPMDPTTDPMMDPMTVMRSQMSVGVVASVRSSAASGSFADRTLRADARRLR